MPRIGRPRSGLALFEFAAVLLIVGLLVGIGVPAVQQSRARAEDRRATRTVTLTLQTAQAAVQAGTPLASLDAQTLGERDDSLRYVDATTASDGPGVVSVGVVGDAWVAASLSRTGRCAVGRLDLATLVGSQDLLQVAVCSAAEAGILPTPVPGVPAAAGDDVALPGPAVGIGAAVTTTRPGTVATTTTLAAATGTTTAGTGTTRAGAAVPTVPALPGAGPTSTAPAASTATSAPATTVRTGGPAGTSPPTNPGTPGTRGTPTTAGTTTTAAATTTTAPASLGTGGSATQVVIAEGGAVSFDGASTRVRGTIGAWGSIAVDEAADITGDVLSRTGSIRFAATSTPHRVAGTVFADGSGISLEGASSTITGATKAWSDISLQGTVAGTAQSRTGTVDCARVSGACTTGSSPGDFPTVDGPDWDWDAGNYPAVTEHASGTAMTAWLSSNASSVTGVHRAWEGFSVDKPLTLTGDTVLVSVTGTITLDAAVTTSSSTPVRLVLVTGAGILVTAAFPADPKVHVAMHAWGDVTFQQAVGLRGWIMSRTGQVLFSGPADLTYAAVRDPGFV